MQIASFKLQGGYIFQENDFLTHKAKNEWILNKNCKRECTLLTFLLEQFEKWESYNEFSGHYLLKGPRVIGLTLIAI